MNVRPVKTRIFKEREELALFITRHVPKLKNGSILAITSKIVALSEGRTADKKEKERVIRSESTWVKKAQYGHLTQRDGMLLWNAGIDESNAAGKIVLLPRNSFKSAEAIRKAISSYPLDKLLLETDCPYLAPVPYRGKRNEPAFIPLIAQKLAEIKNKTLAEIAQQTSQNAKDFFHFP